jgi:DNA polymerase-3 subunit gamma/tau
VPTDPTTGRATIGGRARRDPAPAVTTSTHPSQAGGDKPATAPPAAAAGDGAAPGDEQIAALFEAKVRPALRGMAKAIYMGARVGTMANGSLVIAFAGEPHRARAEEYRHDVEGALAAAVGRSIPLSLVVDQAGHSEGHDDNVVQLKRAEPVQADEDIDTGDLVDVPPDAIVSPIDRLTQAFPGSEIIDERS